MAIIKTADPKDGRPPERDERERFCLRCGKRLSMYNLKKLCYVCQEKERRWMYV